MSAQNAAGAAGDVIVSGGTGALGRAVVRSFLEAGDRVVVPWIAEAERAALAGDERTAVDAGRLALVEADVAEDAGARRTVDAAPSLRAVVNAAGGFAGGDPVHATDLEVWDRLYRTNLRTAVSLSRAAAPRLVEAGGGAILSVAAEAVKAPPAGLAAYTASKAGVVVLTQSLQRELGPHGVRVCAVSPTTIDTPANRRAMPDADFSQWTPPERIAAVLRWLAGSEAVAVRGAVVPV